MDNIQPYTTTVLILTNLDINLQWLYDNTNIIPINKEFNGTKRKKRFKDYITTLNPPYGSLTMMQYHRQIKGWKFNQTSRVFRNGLSMVMYVGKLLTIKIPKRGNIHITGCTEDEQVKLFIHYLLSLLKKGGNDAYTIIHELNNPLNVPEDTIRLSCITFMTNITFKIGFFINLYRLNEYMHQNKFSKNFMSLLETSVGHTGINIKSPFELDKDKISIEHIVYENDNYNSFPLSYDQYLASLPKIPKGECKHVTKKQRHNTFLVFNTGSVIMSGMVIPHMKDTYREFITEMIRARPFIEEVIDDRKK